MLIDTVVIGENGLELRNRIGSSNSFSIDFDRERRAGGGTFRYTVSAEVVADGEYSRVFVIGGSRSFIHRH
jgi:hypothetical protein